MNESQQEPRSAVLEARGVSKRFGGLWALRDVDFHMKSQEIVGLIGPNGSGKTTLLNCLARSLPVTKGTIHFQGDDITDLPPFRVAKQGLTRTFQKVRIFADLSVWENVVLSRQWADVGLWELLRGTGNDTQERAAELLDLVGLRKLETEFAGNLSGGQQRLLELVMAMMPRPSVVMLDEATSGVNPTLIESLKHYLRTLHDQEGVAFLLIEHNVGFIFSMAERIVVLHQGEELANGLPDDVRGNKEVIDAYLGA